MNKPICAPVTGQTALRYSQVQDWAKQCWNDQEIECYCIDAPLFIPDGVVHPVFTNHPQHRTGQAGFRMRDGTM